MSVKYMVLDELLKNKRISGMSLSKQLGVSRNAIWKSVNSLRKDGYKIDGLTNKGYLLLNLGDTLTVHSVEKYLTTENINLHVYDTIGSTNTSLKEWANKAYVEGTVIISQEQTAGKGRLGRNFSSPNKTGLYMSILLRPKFPAKESLSITTAAAVAVAKSIEKYSGQDCKIKWVNDIFMNDKKVCGILTEASINFETGGLEYAILGIGINVIEPENGFESEIKSIAGSVFKETYPEEIRSKLAAEVIDQFMNIYQNLPHSNFIEDYKSRSYLDNKEVTLVVGQTKKTGIVVGVDNDARLLVKLENGEVEAFSAGEALIKKKDEERKNE